MLQPERGQVKLSAYANSGLLTVHVVQARNLETKQRKKCSAFIKVTLHPEDAELHTKCHTEVVPETNQPKFDEKFSFELLEEDLKKRIFISVWNQSDESRDNEFLGCMSFGIQHIVSNRRQVDGWYYLLNEKLGKRKHLQVSTETTDNASVLVGKVISDCMEPYVFVLKKSSGQSFDLEVTGAFPTIVSQCKPGGVAEHTGLEVGDRIIRINGINVSRSTDESVDKIIKSCEEQVILEIQRPRSSSQGRKQLHHTLDIQEGLNEDNYMDQASIMRARTSLNSKERAYNAHMHSMAMHGHSAQMQDTGYESKSIHSSHMHDPRDNFPNMPAIDNHSMMHYGNVLSQRSINVDHEDGYFSEGFPMHKIRTKSQRDGYTSEGGSMSLRRTSTRTGASFREDGYFSECNQGMKMRQKPLHYHPPIPEDEDYIEEVYAPPQQILSMSRTQSRGVHTRKQYQDGYCSEGQPMYTRRPPLGSINEMGGYYSEGGQGLRMNPTRRRHSMDVSGARIHGNMSVQHNRNSMIDIGHHQVMTKEQLQQMYHQYDHEVQDHDDHSAGCPFHQAEEEYVQVNAPKQDKVAAWLDNIPHPNEMTINTIENPFPEINHKGGTLSQDKGHDVNKMQGLGLDPIYEEPEFSVSMLTYCKHQLKPMADNKQTNNKENRPSKTGGMNLFALCGGIAKKKKKKDISC